MAKQIVNRDKVQAVINEFNSLIESGRLQGYLRLMQDSKGYLLVIGRPEQFEYDVYQCKLCHGTLEDCYKTALAIKLAMEVEFQFY